jgi:hypothetical protein
MELALWSKEFKIKERISTYLQGTAFAVEPSTLLHVGPGEHMLRAKSLITTQ